jgi:hypothetical protein
MIYPMKNLSSSMNSSYSFSDNSVQYREDTIDQKTKDLIEIAAKGDELM